MYFNIFFVKDDTYYKNYDYIDLNNIELYQLKQKITLIENKFNAEYGESNKYYLCISNRELDI